MSAYQAIAQRYESDPHFEGVFTEETTLSFDLADRPPGYSDELLAEQYVRFINAVKPMMPTSNLILNANWLGTAEVMGGLIQEMRNARVGAGGSNTRPGNPTQGQSVLMGTYGADYRLELPIANGVELRELGGSATPRQIGTYAYDPLRTHYLFWPRNGWVGTPEQQWFTGILPYLHTRPPVRTRCPNVYGICVTDEPPTVDPQNQPPMVSAGADTSSLPGGTVTLAGSVTDDGLPGPLVGVGWTQVTGPQPAVFADAASPRSQVLFPSAGTYVLQLTASDGELSANDALTVTVTPAPTPTADPDATAADTATATATDTDAAADTDADTDTDTDTDTDASADDEPAAAG